MIILFFGILWFCLFVSMNFDDRVIMCVIIGRLCIEVTSASKIAYISEELCIGCGICVKVLKMLFWCVVVVIFASSWWVWGLCDDDEIVIHWCRNVLLKLFRLSTCQRIWTKTLLIDMVLILLSYTGVMFSWVLLKSWLRCVFCLVFLWIELWL